MKNVKYMLLAFVGLISILPINTFAESIINNNGIEISEEEYNNFLKIHTPEYIMIMNEEKYEKLKSLDYSDIEITENYIESVYNPNLGIITEREMTEEEYENYNPIMPILDSKGASGETSAKKISMAILGGSTYNHVTLTATWKGIPATRSFDVIGVRGYGVSFRNGSQSGEQIYKLNGEIKAVDYAWNGTNIQRHDNGFGISMNIVNDSITALQLAVDCDVTPTLTEPGIFGSYQHAVKSLSLADSQNYTLGASGLGGVFVFPYSISQKYDGMTGLKIQY